jgi:hypothetical protein
MGLVMLILNINIGNEQVTPAYHGPFLLSLKIVFVIFIILCFCGVFASLARGKSNKKGLAG